ncbi:MAG TPA: hypothetical protein VE959_13195 [Bryobacteraceae bacterium]|nr:hypothetical protein [Bryobacteraceae bacterium]
MSHHTLPGILLALIPACRASADSLPPHPRLLFTPESVALAPGDCRTRYREVSPGNFRAAPAV